MPWPGRGPRTRPTEIERLIMPKKPKQTKPARKAAANGPGRIHLRLYVAGQTPRSLAAMANLKQVCEERVPGRYKIELIDLLKEPQLASGDQILAVPTLVRKLPQ